MAGGQDKNARFTPVMEIKRWGRLLNSFQSREGGANMDEPRLDGNTLETSAIRLKRKHKNDKGGVPLYLLRPWGA